MVLKKPCYLLLMLVHLAAATGAQSLSPTVSMALGGSSSAGNVSLSWGMGESFTPTLIAGNSILSQGFQQPEIELATGTLPGGPFCAGGNINVPFTATGFFDASNIFTAQLSDASGSFSSPVNIGSFTGAAYAGNINAVIPSGTLAGSQYKIRVVSSSPVFIGKTAAGTLAVQACGANVWRGITSDWFTPSNWSLNTVPNSCSADVVIPNGTANSPALAAPAGVRNLNIADSAILILIDNLSVCGNTHLGGSAASISGTGFLHFSGSSPQYIDGTGQVENLSADNIQSVTILTGANISIAHELQLRSGTFNQTGNAVVTLLSTGARTAYINDFCAGCTGTYSGDITAQRMVDVSPGNDQHFIGVPVYNRHLADFSDDVNTSGTPGFVIGTSGCSPNASAYNSPYGHAFTWHETAPHPNACAIEGWKVITNNTPTDAGLGFSLYVPNGTLLDVTGPPVTGDVTLNALTNSAQGYLTDGWVLLANPYPSALSLTTSRIADGFDNQVQVWETAGQWYGTYQPHSIGVDADLAQLQGFFVHVTDPGTATWHFYQNERSSQQVPFYRRANESTLTLIASGNGRNDKTVIGFNADATPGFDAALDADKFRGMPGIQVIYTGLQSERIMSINTQPGITQAAAVPMGFAPGSNGQFTISTEGIGSFDATSYIILEDKITGIIHNLRNGPYTFNATTADDENRFVVHFTAPVQIATTAANCAANGNIAITQPGSGNWNFTLTDSANVVIASGMLTGTVPLQLPVPAGIFTLSLSDSSGYTVVKSIEVTGSSTFNISFTAAPIVNVFENVEFKSLAPDAITYQWNFGDGSLAGNVANPTYYYTLPGFYTTVLTATNSKGCTATYTQAITVYGATGINTLNNARVTVQSQHHTVLINFEKTMQDMEVRIRMYDMLGHELSNETHGTSTAYVRTIENAGAGYVLVQVSQGSTVITRRVFISNL